MASTCSGDDPEDFLSNPRWVRRRRLAVIKHALAQFRKAPGLLVDEVSLGQRPGFATACASNVVAAEALLAVLSPFFAPLDESISRADLVTAVGSLTHEPSTMRALERTGRTFASDTTLEISAKFLSRAEESVLRIEGGASELGALRYTTRAADEAFSRFWECACPAGGDPRGITRDDSILYSLMIVREIERVVVDLYENGASFPPAAIRRTCFGVRTPDFWGEEANVMAAAWFRQLSCWLQRSALGPMDDSSGYFPSPAVGAIVLSRFLVAALIQANDVSLLPWRDEAAWVYTNIHAGALKRRPPCRLPRG